MTWSGTVWNEKECQHAHNENTVTVHNENDDIMSGRTRKNASCGTEKVWYCERIPRVVLRKCGTVKVLRRLL